jgi:hypothetical protein
MKESPPTRRLEPPTLEQFRAFVGKVIVIPKADIDKEEARYRQKRMAEKRKRMKHAK